MPAKGALRTSSYVPMTLDDLDNAATAWPEAYIACRAKGHAWDAHTASESGGIIDVTEICLRCKAKRDFQMSARTSNPGEILTRPAVDYPENYLIKGKGRMGADGRGLMRLMTYRAQYPTLTKPEAKPEMVKRPRKRVARNGS